MQGELGIWSYENKILRRVILIMTVAVFVTVALTFFLFNIYTINSIKDFLKQETDAVANTLKSVSDIEEAAEFISADGESYYKIVIFDSDMKLQAQNTSEELNLDKRTGRQLSKAKKDGANFFFASSYKKSSCDKLCRACGKFSN